MGFVPHSIYASEKCRRRRIAMILDWCHSSLAPFFPTCRKHERPFPRVHRASTGRPGVVRQRALLLGYVGDMRRVVLFDDLVAESTLELEAAYRAARDKREADCIKTVLSLADGWSAEALIITPPTALKPPSAAGRAVFAEAVAVVAVVAAPASGRGVAQTMVYGHVQRNARRRWCRQRGGCESYARR